MKSEWLNSEKGREEYRLTRYHVASPNTPTYCGLSPYDPANEDVKTYDTCSIPVGVKAPNGIVSVKWCEENGWCPLCLQKLHDETVPPKAVWVGPGELTDTAIEGPCVIVEKSDSYWAEGGESSAYRSRLLEDPTWEELMAIADEAIEVTGDWFRIRLEGVYEAKGMDLPKLAQAFDEPKRYKVFHLLFAR